MRLSGILALLVASIALSGCRSAHVEATVSNHTAQPISLVEVDYPSASFGTQNLAPGADFHYRFKVLGAGTMKLSYTDTARKEQTATGPYLKEDANGPMVIEITPAGVHWQTVLGSAPPQ